MKTNMNVCSVCGKPIMGYYYEICESLVCYNCGAVNTLSNLHNLGIVDILPDIIEVSGTEKSDDTETLIQSTVDAVYSDLNDEKDATPEQVDAFFNSEKPAFSDATNPVDVLNSVYGMHVNTIQ